MKQKNDVFRLIFLFLLPLLFLMQCRANRYYLAENKTEVSKQEKGDWVVSKKLYVYPGKTYQLVKDGASKPYPVIIDRKDTTLVVLMVTKNLKNPLPDSGMSLKLYIPIPNPLIIKHKHFHIPLNDVVFGLQAFMDGAGYKKLNDGNIKLFHRKGKIILSISLQGRFLEEFNGEYPLSIK